MLQRSDVNFVDTSMADASPEHSSTVAVLLVHDAKISWKRVMMGYNDTVLKVCAPPELFFLRPMQSWHCRKTKTTSGFRSRNATPTGRRVLKARRKKGRKVLCPASLRKDGKNRV